MPALQAFIAGFDQLANATDQPGAATVDHRLLHQHVHEGYRALQQRQARPGRGVAGDERAEVPAGQLHRACGKSDDVAVTIDDAHDGSAWSAANARYQDFFRQIVQRFEFQDALLLDTRGNVVYTAYKDVDLGTNILTGPYNTSLSRGAYEKALASNSDDYVGITDFEIYQPAEGQPTAWMVSPVSANGRTEGVMALQFPITKINRLMTFDKQWAASGMGDTGETFLAGPDDLMRSDSRLLLQEPGPVQARRGASRHAARCRRNRDPAGHELPDPARGGEATHAAQRGESGTMITTDYLGHETLQAYAPVVIPGQRAALVDRGEARHLRGLRAGVDVHQNHGDCPPRQSSSSSVWRRCSRPRSSCGRSDDWKPARRRISGGDYDVAIPVESRDEIGDLTQAFNEMSRNLAIKEDLLNEQRQENDRLLSLLMPEPVVERYRQGEEIIAQDHQDVSVIFADIVGLDRLQAELTSEESLSIINELARQIDAAADELGIEPVRTVHNGYLASCGLNVPRLDNVRRTVDFALEAQRIVDRFNGETGRDLGLRAGIDTGPVSSGLVGRPSIVYDMWGAAVNLAYQVQSGSPQDGIYVTPAGVRNHR